LPSAINVTYFRLLSLSGGDVWFELNISNTFVYAVQFFPVIIRYFYSYTLLAQLAPSDKIGEGV